MPELTVRPHALRDAAEHCDATVTAQVDVAVREFAAAEGAPGAAHMGTMLSAGAARACIDSWHETFRQASRAMQAVGGKLWNTGAVVVDTDTDAADLYRGPVPDLPPISVNVTE